jgi:hypothetical protein
LQGLEGLSCICITSNLCSQQRCHRRPRPVPQLLLLLVASAGAGGTPRCCQPACRAVLACIAAPLLTAGAAAWRVQQVLQPLLTCQLHSGTQGMLSVTISNYHDISILG